MQAKAYLYQTKEENNAEAKLAEFKESLKVFEGITSIAKARAIAKEKFHIQRDINFIKLDNAQCVIMQSADFFRVCLEDEKEFICYNITRAKEVKGVDND